MPFVWDEKTMGTGVPELDTQHQELIRRLQALLTALGAGRNDAALGAALDSARAYARWHIAQEEACMADRHCPAAAAARSAHRRFLDAFEQISSRVKAEGPKRSLAIRAERELADWVRHHIVRIDSQLRECARRESGAEPELERAQSA